MNSFYKNFHHHYAIDAYKYLGSHFEDPSLETVSFRVFAPHAEEVSVVGDFNNWNQAANKMTKITKEGIWEAKIKGICPYTNYKYYLKNGLKTLFKQDPYSYHFETDGNTCSKVYNLEGFTFKNDHYQKSLKKGPMNIYEVNLASWKRRSDGSFLDYRSLADQILPYVKEMGYTHLEIMPLTEYPFLGSWGYQATGYFGITSRFGTPHDFMYFVDKAHEIGIGVILDWVPGHFAKDDFGLIEFDGDFVYEDPHPLKREHRNWGTRVFNYGKPEVKSFLISSACFLFETYHIDGLRVDAVASMLYLDYDRNSWVKNNEGGNINFEAIGFLQDLNTEVLKHYPNALMIAEESSSFPGVTKIVSDGGLGFTHKWNMGWMNDTLDYISKDPYFRKDYHSQITFSMMYAFNENYILPFSHDEVVHLKKSMLSKMPGELDKKFKNLRAIYGYQMTHPGKKLNFMGMEFGQLSEWDYNDELEWFLLKRKPHKLLHNFIRDMNKIYLEYDMLWELDNSWEGFSWIDVNADNHNLLIYKRLNKTLEGLIVIINFSGSDWLNFRIGVSQGNYQEVINSDDKKYGGSGLLNFRLISQNIPQHNFSSSLLVNIPALSIIILRKDSADV